MALLGQMGPAQLCLVGATLGVALPQRVMADAEADGADGLRGAVEEGNGLAEESGGVFDGVVVAGLEPVEGRADDRGCWGVAGEDAGAAGVEWLADRAGGFEDEVEVLFMDWMGWFEELLGPQ